jgi:hypothetical protein
MLLQMLLLFAAFEVCSTYHAKYSVLDYSSITEKVSCFIVEVKIKIDLGMIIVPRNWLNNVAWIALGNFLARGRRCNIDWLILRSVISYFLSWVVYWTWLHVGLNLIWNPLNIRLRRIASRSYWYVVLRMSLIWIIGEVRVRVWVLGRSLSYNLLHC